MHTWKKLYGFSEILITGRFFNRLGNFVRTVAYMRPDDDSRHNLLHKAFDLYKLACVFTIEYYPWPRAPVDTTGVCHNDLERNRLRATDRTPAEPVHRRSFRSPAVDTDPSHPWNGTRRGSDAGGRSLRAGSVDERGARNSGLAQNEICLLS